MKNQIKDAINRIKLPSAYLSIRSQVKKPWGILVIYHRVDNSDNFPWALSPVDPVSFEKQIDFLARHYEIVSLDDLAGNIKLKKAFSKKPAVITFDDGFKDNYTIAYPILQKKSIPATIFIATSRIECEELFWSDKINYACWVTGLSKIDAQELGDLSFVSPSDRKKSSARIKASLKTLSVELREEKITRILDELDVEIPADINRDLMLSWDEIRDMGKNGIDFGAHSVSHNSLTEYSIPDAEKEIAQSKSRLEEELGIEVTTFSYPYGKNSDYNSSIIDIVQKNGFQCAVTTNFGLVTNESDPYELPRISGTNLSNFYLHASALTHDFKFLS